LFEIVTPDIIHPGGMVLMGMGENQGIQAFYSFP
jgi:hypothetical protein